MEGSSLQRLLRIISCAELTTQCFSTDNALVLKIRHLKFFFLLSVFLLLNALGML